MWSALVADARECIRAATADTAALGASSGSDHAALKLSQAQGVIMDNTGAISGSREPSQSSLSRPVGFDPERIYGYFDGPSDAPTYDPGAEAPCPACGKPVTREAVRTQSILVPGDYRCYFFRYHIACADDPKVQEVEHWIVEHRYPVADTINKADGRTTAEIIEGIVRGSQCAR